MQNSISRQDRIVLGGLIFTSVILILAGLAFLIISEEKISLFVLILGGIIMGSVKPAGWLLDRRRI
jgi:hypothetical protein